MCVFQTVLSTCILEYTVSLYGITIIVQGSNPHNST